MRIEPALIVIGTGKCFDRAAVLSPCAHPIIVVPVEGGPVLQSCEGDKARYFFGWIERILHEKSYADQVFHFMDVGKMYEWHFADPG
jgi:hypothetical protein